MNDRIEQTDAEREAAAKAIHSYRPGHPGEYGYDVDLVVDAINKARAGDPVGTIRRSEGGTVAVKVREQEVAWELIVPNFVGCWSNSDDVASWPVVYRPEVES